MTAMKTTIIAPPTPHTTPATIGVTLGAAVVDVVDDDNQSVLVVVCVVVGGMPEQHQQHRAETKNDCGSKDYGCRL